MRILNNWKGRDDDSDHDLPAATGTDERSQMTKGIAITRRENHDSRIVRVWTTTHDLARSLKKRTGRPMVEIFHLALEQVRVAGHNGKAK